MFFSWLDWSYKFFERIPEINSLLITSYQGIDDTNDLSPVMLMLIANNS